VLLAGESSRAMLKVLESLVYLYLVLSKSYTCQTVHHIFTLNGSNDADSLRGVPLALIYIAAHLGDQIAQKPQFWGRE